MWAPWPIISKGPQQGWENFSETHLFLAIFNHLYRGSVVGFWLRIHEYWSYVSDDIIFVLNLCTSPEPASQDIIKQSGYLITPEDFQELLEEAARYLDIPQKNGSLASMENHEKKHIPWKMNGFCTWKSRCCGKGNHLKQTFMTSGASHEFGEGCTWPSPFPPLTKGTQQHNPPTDPLWDFVVIKKTWCNGNFGGSLPKRFILSLGEVFPLNGLAFSISVNGWWFF